MSTSLGKLLVWVESPAACVRVVGRANFLLSVDFRKLLRHLRSAGCVRLLLDLTGCQMMDSTFIGVLAFEANAIVLQGGEGASPIQLVNAQPAVREIIEDLGIGRFFEFVERDLSRQPFEPAPSSGPTSAVECAQTSLEVHNLLMALNPANEAKFKEVTRFLAEELKAVSGTEAPPGSGPAQK